MAVTVYAMGVRWLCGTALFLLFHLAEDTRPLPFL